MKKIGITTTVPIEILLAAQLQAVDLNNILIADGRSDEFIQEAEKRGYPRNVCGWIKGIYGIVSTNNDIETVIAVTQGDCSNTHALMGTLELLGKEVIPFAYPYDRKASTLLQEMKTLANRLGAKWGDVLDFKEELDKVREKALHIDRLTWQTGQVTGLENHVTLVTCSDFGGDHLEYGKKLDKLLIDVSSRQNSGDAPRIGLIGVPPIMTDLHDTIESYGCNIVFNEVSRQFAMPYPSTDIVEQYLQYTYPYSVFVKIQDIQEQIKLRKLDGIIHYVQSFCFRQIEDLVYREKLEIPILTLEGSDPAKTDQRQRMRIQAFVEMLR